jgi:hypothetical protein
MDWGCVLPSQHHLQNSFAVLPMGVGELGCFYAPQEAWCGKRHGDNQLGLTRCSSTGRHVGEQELLSGRVQCVFKDACNGCSIKREGDNDGRARESELVDLKG